MLHMSLCHQFILLFSMVKYFNQNYSSLATKLLKYFEIIRSMLTSLFFNEKVNHSWNDFPFIEKTNW